MSGCIFATGFECDYTITAEQIRKCGETLRRGYQEKTEWRTTRRQAHRMRELCRVADMPQCRRRQHQLRRLWSMRSDSCADVQK